MAILDPGEKESPPEKNRERAHQLTGPSAIPFSRRQRR